jgi:hypothetical protein
MISWLRIRRKRDALLQWCDWTQANDSPLSEEKKAEWRAYRQALRELPDTYSSATDKSEVVWPTKPI